jgi:cell division topological specificity factor
MSNFIDRLLGRSPASAQTAKERLQFVLIHDRTDISPAVMEAMKDEIIAVISKHVNIDRSAVEINLTQQDRENRLVANIPLLPAASARKRRGAARAQATGSD